MTSTGIGLVPTAAPQRGAEPFLREQRRVDPAGEPDERLDRLGGRRLLVAQELHRRGPATRVGQRLGEAEVHRQGDQVLLGAVVDVALQEPALVVLGVDQPLARAAQLLGAGRQLLEPLLELGAQPRAAQHQAGLGGQPGEQPFLDRRQRHLVALLDDEHAEQLSAVPHREGPGGRVAVRSPAVAAVLVRPVGSRVASGGQVAASVGRSPTTSQTCDHSAPVPSASTRAIRAGSSSAGVAAGHGPGEPPQHVVRRGLAAVHGARRDRLEPGLDPVEGQRHHGGGEDREGHVGATSVPARAPPPSTTTT